MNTGLKNQFIALWKKYFGKAELPVAFYYTDSGEQFKPEKPPKGHGCLIGVLSRVRRGESLCFDADSIGCPGGRKYTGFSQSLMPGFEYFLSCGIVGKMEGERYKKTPELVKESLEIMPEFRAAGKYLMFKRWDMLDETDSPAAVVFFATPDILSGLFTLANYDEAEQNGVIALFSAGCGSIIMYPFLEGRASRQRAVLGMFDVSARPYVETNCLTFTVPFGKLEKMIRNMDESFLITPSWEKVKKRI